jgi:hypothetical protein
MLEQQARQQLLAAGVPDRALLAWHDPSSILRIAFTKPNFRFAENLESAVPGLAGLIPIFERNGEAVLGYLPETSRFVQFYYEDGLRGDDAIQVLAVGYQQFAAHVLLEFEDSGLSSDFEVVSETLEFRRAAELRRLIDADPYDDSAVETFFRALAEVR